MIVVDASVAAKLYRDETGSDEAHSLIEASAGRILVPDIFAVEVAGVIVRDANSDKLIEAIQREKLTHLAALLAGPTFELIRSAPGSIADSAELAVHLGHPLKDCLYLTLAIGCDCELVTADTRFAAKARSVWERVCVLGE